MPDDDADLDEDEVEALEAAIEADYDIGDTIRRSLVRVCWACGCVLGEGWWCRWCGRWRW